MKVTAWISLAIAMSVLAGQAATADHPRNPDFNKRQEHQKERIKQGARSGELTKTEARDLAAERSDIKKIEREYRADGVVTRAERRELDQRLDAASGEILLQKHDAQDRSSATAAGTHDPLVNARQQNQTDRIVPGVASGELTRKEAAELAEEHRDIKQLERDYKSDGTLSGQERRDLHQQLDEAGEEIREEKHDEQQR